MENILSTISLGLILRSMIAGVFFLLSYFTATDGTRALEKIAAVDTGKLLAVVAFVGVLGYTLHRAVVYPFLEWGFTANWAQSFRKRVPLISKNTRESLADRWERSTHAQGKSEHVSKHLTTWADYTHLFYSSALCIGLGALTATTNTEHELIINLPLVMLAMTFGISALASDWRLRSVEECCAARTSREPGAAPTKDRAEDVTS